MTQTTNAAGIELIKSFEQLRLAAYDDNGRLPGGTWTIGWGHTKGVRPGDTITAQRADDLLREDLAWAERLVIDTVKAPLNPNQFAALVSFAFNLGPGAKGVKDGFARLESGRQPTIVRKLNQGDYAGAAAEFLKWTRGPAGTSKGLKRRREAERALFLKPV